MTEQRNARPDYEVGYKRPPKESRYRKGECGNPDGRPPKRHTLGGTIEDMLGQLVTVRDENGRPKRMEAREAVAHALVNGALSGNLKMVKDIVRLEREGHLDDGDTPLTVHIINGLPDDD